MATRLFDPWPNQRCLQQVSPPQLADLFAQTIADSQDEAPLQTFLAAHPQLLTCLLPPGHDAWCWDRPRFGSELIPDFLLCTRNSTGYQWVMVELESPTVRPLNQGGLPGSKLNHALGQVRDWRAWLRVNIAYAQNQLGFTQITAESSAVVVIGRRNGLDPGNAAKWRELSEELTLVMTYDRLLGTIPHGRRDEGVSNE